ncbi:MAG TPA: PIN domain-containing protein [Planctomycetota bacterium]|nr:PIN domain-containing protein [Planctomycetota bacterium]
MIFADSFYFIALLNSDDEGHEKAVSLAEEIDEEIVTSYWVLTEVADAFSHPSSRRKFLEFYDDVSSNALFSIQALSTEDFDKGLLLYRARPDKAWSLTDCISFAVMKERGITDALTGDHHFKQAGFNVLMK